jgi:uncharacterized protein (UPF0261 family)
LPTVVLVGTLDTKGPEIGFVRERLRNQGVDVIVMDTGVLDEPTLEADISRQEVASAAGVDLEDLRTTRDRGAAVTSMAEGAAEVVRRLHQDGAISGGLALGGTGGTSIGARALRELPLGVPKVIVSTAASGNTYTYIRETDLILIPSVVDIAGLNRISNRILANAAAALAGMVAASPLATEDDRPIVAASMFGVTTPCVTEARSILEDQGYEVLVFHMTGTGGRALESLAAQGFLAGVLDVTTTELADHLVGGIFDAGPDRLKAAGANGVPQVVSVGALDMVNFGAPDTVPSQFEGRVFYEHNPNTTLMRTTAEETAILGERLGQLVSSAQGPTAVFLPLRGISAIATEGMAFHDPEADQRLFEAIRANITNDAVELTEMDTDINDPTFARAMAARLIELVEG